MRILVTAGPTREHFDSVRFLSNASSGKMGFSIAAEAVQRGHEVILIAGPVSLPDPEGAEVIRVVTAGEMFDACRGRFAACDAAVMAAAVADYRPARRSARKVKKHNQSRTVELRPTKDICAALGARKGERIVVGFAMEDRDHHRRAETKMRRKQCDAIVLNRVETLGAETARVEILRGDSGWARPMSGSKARIASGVLDLVESLVAGRLR